MIFFPLLLSLRVPLYGFDKSNASFAVFAVFFLRFVKPLPVVLPMGPDQAWNGSFEKVYDIESKETSWGTISGSIWFEAPKGNPSCPSSCGGGNFSLLLLALAWVIRRLLCYTLKHRIKF